MEIFEVWASAIVASWWSSWPDDPWTQSWAGIICQFGCFTLGYQHILASFHLSWGIFVIAPTEALRPFPPTGHSRWPKRCGTLSSLRRLHSPRQTSLKSIYKGWGGSLSTGTPWMSEYLARTWSPTICLTTCTTMWLCGPRTSKLALAGVFIS